MAWDAYAKFGPIFDKYDAFICPTNAVTGIPADHGYPNLEYVFNGETRKTEETGDESMWLTTPFNMLSRLPVMSAPTGFASNGVPTGMQIIGKAYDDNNVFKASLNDLDCRDCPTLNVKSYSNFFRLSFATSIE